MGCEKCELSVLLVDDEEIRRLNRIYRNVDRATNVLAFPMQQGEEVEVQPHILGDVVVSVETALRETAEWGHSPEEHLLYLFIHGILHLLGYGDEDSQGERRMREAQDDLFRRAVKKG